MAMTGSFIARTIADFRRHTDEPELNAKYTDAVLIEMIEQAYQHVIGEINRNRKEPIVAKYEVTYATGTTSYLLPALGTVFAVYKKPESDSNVKIFYDSRGILNPRGRYIWFQGNELHIQSGTLNDGDVVVIEYVPTGCARLHTGVCTVDTTGKIVTWASTTDGTLDTALNAYAGSIFRIVSDADASYDYVQERQVVSSDRTGPSFTLNLALNPNAGDGVQSGDTSYEIAPAISRGMDHVIALYLAFWVSSTERDPERAGAAGTIYRNALRTLRLDAFYSNLMEAPRTRSDNYRHRRVGR